MRRKTHPLYHLHFRPLSLSSLLLRNMSAEGWPADLLFICWAYGKRKYRYYYFESPLWVTWVSLKFQLFSTTCAHNHAHTHSYSLLPICSQATSPPITLISLCTSPSPPSLPSAMQQLFIDNNDQWEQVLWESSHPGTQGTQHTSSSPASQSLHQILQ